MVYLAASPEGASAVSVAGKPRLVRNITARVWSADGPARTRAPSSRVGERGARQRSVRHRSAGSQMYLVYTSGGPGMYLAGDPGVRRAARAPHLLSRRRTPVR